MSNVVGSTDVGKQGGSCVLGEDCCVLGGMTAYRLPRMRVFSLCERSKCNSSGHEYKVTCLFSAKDKLPTVLQYSTTRSFDGGILAGAGGQPESSPLVLMTNVMVMAVAGRKRTKPRFLRNVGCKQRLHGVILSRTINSSQQKSWCFPERHE